MHKTYLVQHWFEEVVDFAFSLESFQLLLLNLPLFVNVLLLPSYERLFIHVRVNFHVTVIRQLEVIPFRVIEFADHIRGSVGVELNRNVSKSFVPWRTVHVVHNTRATTTRGEQRRFTISFLSVIDMLSTLTQSFLRLSVRSSTCAGPSSRPSTRPFVPISNALFQPIQQARHAGQLAPRKTKYRKAHKGKVPLHLGGSLKGTTLSEGAYGIRLLAPARISAKQLQSAEAALKRKLKIVKGSQVFLRVFPDIAVCAKGNETRMGKGKGSFQFWAAR